MDNQPYSYGGQAVIEGVMMRGRRQAAVVVCGPTGKVAYKHIPLNSWRRSAWEQVPLLRGILMLWDVLNLGVRALHFSASVASGEPEELSRGAALRTLAASLCFTIGLFFLVPLLLASLAGYFGASLLERELLEGLFRLGLIVGYIVLISRFPDIQRVFGYHGAEHKVVNAYEAGAPLTVESVQRFSIVHPRCGTSFLAVVVIISFIVFVAFGGLPLWARLLSRIVLVPFIAAVAYEVLRFAAKQQHRVWVRRLMTPSLWLQHLTVREPDTAMIAVAIAALQVVLVADGVPASQVIPVDEHTLATTV